jgi:hypothetical protein
MRGHTARPKRSRCTSVQLQVVHTPDVGATMAISASAQQVLSRLTTVPGSPVAFRSLLLCASECKRVTHNTMQYDARVSSRAFRLRALVPFAECGACAVRVFRFPSLLSTLGALRAGALAFSSCYKPLSFL